MVSKQQLSILGCIIYKIINPHGELLIKAIKSYILLHLQDAQTNYYIVVLDFFSCCAASGNEAERNTQ